jgi:putative membrane protein
MLGSRLAFLPGETATALGFVLAGVLLGTLSGLVPGLHANSMAFLLAAALPALPGPPRLVAAAMLAAGVVHTFLDVVPALALGVPDPAFAVSALPGHRLVLGGQGREALRLSALGSGLAVVLAAPLAVPVTRGMQAAYPVLRAHLPLLLGGVALFLVLTEASNRARLVGALSLCLACGLGVLALPLDPTGPLPVGGVLAPLFAGLFGAPVLIDAARGTGVPPQAGAQVTTPRLVVAGLAAIGTLSGALVAYLPGVSSVVAATLALAAAPGRHGARGFIVATSGVDTANTVFALFALVALGTPRTGVLVAVQDSGAPLDLPLLLSAVVLASCVGFLLVPLLGDRYLALAGRFDPRWLSGGVLSLLVVLSGLFAGVVGEVLFAVATAVGLVPVRLGARRVHLMGVLYPLILLA